MIKYWFNKELNILEVIYANDISSEEIVSYNEFVCRNKVFPRELNVIIDAQTAHYDFSTKTIQVLLDIAKECMQNYSSIRVALIHSKPLETAYSSLIEPKKTHPNYFHKIFTTREAALEWLQ